jgi:hypothetical protein
MVAAAFAYDVYDAGPEVVYRDAGLRVKLLVYWLLGCPLWQLLLMIMMNCS